MRALRLLWLLPPLAACQATPPVAASPYACPDGRVVQAGLAPDRRLLVLVIDGERHTLGRRPEGEGYGNGRYQARMDDLFLHLGIAGSLLPQHCRLLPGSGRTPGDSPGRTPPRPEVAEPE